ncbi:MAG: hypothetical protein ACI9ME_002274, partial [Ilumatobacter sp.]
GATQKGPIPTALSWRPLVAIGKVSYGLYLIHWPLFLVLSPERLDLHGPALTLVRLVALGAITAASYALIEQPIRQGRLIVGPTGALLASMGCAAALIAGTFVTTVQVNASTTSQLLADATGDVIAFSDASERTPDIPSTDIPSTDIASTEVRHVAQATTPDDQPPLPEPVTVLIVGSDPHAVDVLQNEDLAGLVIIDGVQRGCPAMPGLEARLVSGEVIDISDCERTATRVRRLSVQHRPSMIVVSLGPLDDSIVRQRIDVGFPQDNDLAQIGDHLARAEAVISSEVERLVADDVAVGVAWWGSDGVMLRALDRIAIAEQHIPPVITADGELIALITPLLDGAADPAPVSDLRRVLVFGDSTSLTFARALHDADAGFEVLWAGDNGCPVVRAVALRPASGGESKSLNCPGFDVKIPPLLESFAPDFAILVAGPVELTEQFYPGDPDGHLPGSDRYAQFHDTELAAIADLFAGHGVPIFVADAPSILQGIFASQEMTEPARLDAWNNAIRRFDERHANVTIFEYSKALVEYEATHGSIRPDGIHPEIEPLTDLVATVLVDQF